MKKFLDDKPDVSVRDKNAPQRSRTSIRVYKIPPWHGAVEVNKEVTSGRDGPVWMLPTERVFVSTPIGETGETMPRQGCWPTIMDNGGCYGGQEYERRLVIWDYV